MSDTSPVTALARGAESDFQSTSEPTPLPNSLFSVIHCGSRSGSEARDAAQATHNADDDGSAMSTVLFDRARPAQGEDVAYLSSAASCRLPTASAETSDARARRSSCEGGCVVVHQGSGGTEETAGGSRSSMAYGQQVSGPDSARPSHTECNLEARELLFDDVDETATATATVRATSLEASGTRARPATATRLSPPSASQEETVRAVVAEVLLREDAPTPRLAPRYTTSFSSPPAHPDDADDYDDYDDDNNHDGNPNTEGDGTMMTVTSPDPRMVVPRTDGRAAFRCETGRRSDEGLVPSLARDDTDDTAAAAGGGGDDGGDPVESVGSRHGASGSATRELALETDDWLVTLRAPRSASADDQHTLHIHGDCQDQYEEDDDNARFFHLAAHHHTGRAPSDPTTGLRRHQLLRSAEETALVNSRSRTRGSSGSLALPPPPPPPQHAASWRRQRELWLSPPGTHASSHDTHDDDDVDDDGGVDTPSVGRDLAHARRLVPPPPPPPPPPMDSHETTPERTPTPPARPLRVLCAPSPSPPRGEDGGEEIEAAQSQEDQRLPSYPMPQAQVAVAADSVSATASVIDEMAVGLDDIHDDDADEAHFADAFVNNVAEADSHPTHHSGQERRSMESVLVDAPLTVDGHGAMEKSEEKEEEEDESARLASHVRPVGSVVPDLVSGSPFFATPQYDICAPLKASGSLCPMNQLILSTGSPALEAGLSRNSVPAAAPAQNSEDAETTPAMNVAPTEASPSPIPPSRGSCSFQSDMYTDDDNDDNGNEEGTSCGGSEEPCLHPGVAPQSLPKSVQRVFECGAAAAAPLMDSVSHEEEDNNNPMAAYSASSSSSPASSASPTPFPASRTRESYGSPAAASCSSERELAMEALHAQLQGEVEKRLEREEECLALHELVAALRGKLNVTTVAALAHNGDRKALHHNHSHHASAVVAPDDGDEVVAVEEEDSASCAAEAVLWRARHDQLAVELAHVKQQLAEQKAVLDVLGLAPPYPQELLGAAKRVVRRLHYPTTATRAPTDGDDSGEPSIADASVLDTPVPIIATLYRRSGEATAGADKVIDGNGDADTDVHLSVRQQRAASTAHRALSELSANTVRLSKVDRVLAKSRERSEANAVPSFAVVEESTQDSHVSARPDPFTRGDDRVGCGVAEALRRNREQRQQQQQEQQQLE